MSNLTLKLVVLHTSGGIQPVYLYIPDGADNEDFLREWKEQALYYPERWLGYAEMAGSKVDVVNMGQVIAIETPELVEENSKEYTKGE